MRTTHEHLGSGHRALLYHDPAGFVDAVGGFVRDGLREGDQVLAAVTPEKFRWLREELGGDANAIDFMETEALYERHGPMFRTLIDYVQRHGASGQQGVRIVAEPTLRFRTPAELRAYMRYEAASNVAFSQFDASVLCPYDAERVPGEILRDALRTHAEVLEHGRARRSELFVDPRAFVRQGVRDRAASPGTPGYRLERPEDIAGARALVGAQAAAAGLARQAIEDLVIAVSEVATNALIHGRAPRRLWSYLEDGHLVCHVRDAGSGLTDPLSGYLPPDRERLGGRGLWLAHQLCHIVEISSDSTRTDVYLHVKLPAAA